MPQPRITLGRVTAYLQEFGETQANKLAEALGITPGTLTSAVKPAVLERAVTKRKDGHHVFYSLGDGIRPEQSYKAPEVDDSFNASLWADGDLVLYGVELNEDGKTVTLNRSRVATLRRLLSVQVAA